jgi:putative ABC transport system substrate-binding protein
VTRRSFITLLGGVAAGWPLAARAQQPAIPIVGFLRSTSFAAFQNLLTAFRQGLKDAGFVDGQNVAIEYLSAEDHPDRLAALVADLIRRPVAVIVGNSVSARAAKAATSTVPIVFAYGGDPVRDSLVTSLNRPGGNVTGVVFFSSAVGAKRLELLRQLVPGAKTIAVLMDTTSLNTEEREDVRAAAQALGQQIMVFDAGSDHGIETTFEACAQHGTGALLVGGGPFLNSRRERTVALAARYALPTSYAEREAVVVGGLMSYGASIIDAYRQVGIYAGRILKGEKPGDLPVIRSTKIEFVINLKTAKTLGLTVPPSLLALADEVIE